MLPDKPLLSPVRLWFAFREWQYFKHRGTGAGLLFSLLYNDRPHAHWTMHGDRYPRLSCYQFVAELFTQRSCSDACCGKRR